MYYDNPIDFDYRNTLKNFQYQQYIPDKEPSFLTTTFYNTGLLLGIFLFFGGILYFKYKNKKKTTKVTARLLKKWFISKIFKFSN